MKLREIFQTLDKEQLRAPLEHWFREAEKTIRGKLMSLSFATELSRESWQPGSEFGIHFSRRFAQFLQQQNGRADPVSLGIGFCQCAPPLTFLGRDSQAPPAVAHVLRFQQLLDKLELNYLDQRFFSPRGLSEEIARLLPMRDIAIGFDGTAWVTPYGDELKSAPHARVACDQLGRLAAPNQFYAVLGIDPVPLLKCPTIYDGRLDFRSCAHDGPAGWGRAVTQEQCARGAPLAVMREVPQKTSLLRLLEPDPVPPPVVPVGDDILAQCFMDELRLLTARDPLASADLEHAWSPPENWWRSPELIGDEHG